MCKSHTRFRIFVLCTSFHHSPFPKYAQRYEISIEPLYPSVFSHVLISLSVRRIELFDCPLSWVKQRRQLISWSLDKLCMKVLSSSHMHEELETFCMGM
ncbi:unnamed protein product [Hymenolepis diminuta]|uniref:Uncharacterized protein n=1 Tax=Hymenolepis diminuta TaxID=6216 RepID=A0A564YWR9_HYMDI|nr:unnamed protein product [Hymenolepis diminuta]